MTDKCILKAVKLNKSYGKRIVITDLDIEINKGDIYGFLGPNGAGKTTTIRMILGLIKHNSGSVVINGHNIKTNIKTAISKVGAVVEVPKFYENYSAYSNLKMTKNLYSNVPNIRINEVLELTGLSTRARDKVKTFSLGMKQRLGIARALIHNPELVILDEPTNGLDPQGMKEIRELILKLAKENNITFFISSHLLSEIEHTCNKVGIIKNGKKIVEGYVSDLLNSELESVELTVDKISQTKEVLKDIQYIKSIEEINNNLLVKIDSGYSANLSKLIIENNISLQYLVPKPQSLENFFIETTKGGNHIV